MNFADVAAVAMENNRRLRAGEHRRVIDDDSELLPRGHHDDDDDERSPPAAAAAATGPTSLKYLQGSVLDTGGDVLIRQKAVAVKSGGGGGTPASNRSGVSTPSSGDSRSGLLSTQGSPMLPSGGGRALAPLAAGQGSPLLPGLGQSSPLLSGLGQSSPLLAAHGTPSLRGAVAAMMHGSSPLVTAQSSSGARQSK